MPLSIQYPNFSKQRPVHHTTICDIKQQKDHSCCRMVLLCCLVCIIKVMKGFYNELYLFTCLESGRACLISSFLDSIIITRNNVPRVRFFFKFSLTSNNRTSFSVRKTYLFHTAFLNYLLSI